MRQFYHTYPILAKASQELSWSHYVELLKIEDPLERNFYEQQSIRERWSIPELKHPKQTNLFLRLDASKSKEEILRLAQEGQSLQKPEDLIREHYVLEFLNLPEPYHLKGLLVEMLLSGGYFQKVENSIYYSKFLGDNPNL